MKKVMKDGKEYIVFENYQDMVAHREICANHTFYGGVYQETS